MNTSNWNIDAVHSGIGFSIRHMVVSKVRGRFGRFSGNLVLDDDGDLTKSAVEATIDVSSIDTGVPQRDTHLRSADFFEVERFPEMKFRSTRIEKVSGERYRVTGDLTVRDITREIVLDVEHGGRAKDPWGNERTGFIATTTFDRKDFGLRWTQLLETGGVLVGDRVDIELEVQAVKAAAAKAA
jgi:polyisoprenoid-binding protein YceI